MNSVNLIKRLPTHGESNQPKIGEGPIVEIQPKPIQIARKNQSSRFVKIIPQTNQRQLLTQQTSNSPTVGFNSEEHQDAPLFMSHYSKATLSDLNRRLHLSGILTRVKNIPSRDAASRPNSEPKKTEERLSERGKTQACKKQPQLQPKEAFQPAASFDCRSNAVGQIVS
jgi:hypothetical protein